MEFSRHNVILPDGSATAPGRRVMAQSPPFQALLRLLGLLFPNQPNKDIRIADLGCMEGGAALELARAGYRVLGVEARERHIERCEFLRKQFGLENLSFAHDRVENLERHGRFDAVYASGILYHLERPAEFITLLGRVARGAVIINTHFAEDGRIPSRFRHKLSKMTRHEGRRGRWYAEWPKNAPPEQIAALQRTAVGNRRSFWLTKDELLEAMRAAGFDTLFESLDGHYTMKKALTAIRRNSRGVFVGVKRDTGA